MRCSREFSQQLAKELHVPVYLYECAQEREYRTSLGQIREGEYEGLKEKVQNPVSGSCRCGLPYYSIPVVVSHGQTPFRTEGNGGPARRD